jgi:hypothetical protein
MNATCGITASKLVSVFIPEGETSNFKDYVVSITGKKVLKMGLAGRVRPAETDNTVLKDLSGEFVRFAL